MHRTFPFSFQKLNNLNIKICIFAYYWNLQYIRTRIYVLYITVYNKNWYLYNVWAAPAMTTLIWIITRCVAQSHCIVMWNLYHIIDLSILIVVIESITSRLLDKCGSHILWNKHHYGRMILRLVTAYPA